MKKNDFWLLSLLVLWIIGYSTNMSLPLRIAIGANAVVVLLDTVRQAWRILHGREEA